MSVTLVPNPHNRYRCHSCDDTFDGEPVKGHWFNINQYTGASVEDDGDPFIPGDIKLLKGTSAWKCPEGGCYLDADDWSLVECEAWECSCGVRYSFDNDYCGIHAWSDKDLAKRAADACPCGSNQPEAVTRGCPYKAGDLVVTTVKNPESAPLEAGQLCQVDKIGSQISDGVWRLTVQKLQGDKTRADDSNWYVDTNHLAPFIDEQEQAVLDALTRKEAPKKKVTYIDF